MIATELRTEEIIQKNVWWSMGAGAVPVPFVDIVAVTVIQLDLLRELCAFYGVDYSQMKGKALISAISGSILARYWASLLKTSPGFGSILGGVSMAIMSGATTYALGKVFDKYFSENYSLDEIDEKEARKLFRKEFRKGKRIVRILERSRQGDVYEQLDKLGSLKEKGILTEEEFAEKKKKLLEQI